MKRYIFSLLLLSSIGASQAMTWIEKDGHKVTREAIKALKILGIKASEDIKEANEVLQKYYEQSLNALKKGEKELSLETEKGKKVSKKKLKKFVKFIDKHTKDITIDKDTLARETVAIVPASTVLKVNEYIFKLLKKHIHSISRVVIFAQDEKNKEEIKHLFEKTFAHFKNVEYKVASDTKDAIKDCSHQVKKEWEKSKETPDYAIFTHLKTANDSIKEYLAGNYKGTEFKALPWKKHKKWFSEPNIATQAWSYLRDVSSSVGKRVKDASNSVGKRVKNVYEKAKS